MLAPYKVNTQYTMLSGWLLKFKLLIAMSCCLVVYVVHGSNLCYYKTWECNECNETSLFDDVRDLIFIMPCMGVKEIMWNFLLE